VAVAAIAKVVIRFGMVFFNSVGPEEDIGLRFVVGPEDGAAIAPTNSGEVRVEIPLNRAMSPWVFSPGLILISR
jgi:hypothetical protein